MRLTPHVVVETIIDMGAQSPIWRTPAALPGVVQLIRSATLFDFGSLHPSMEHKAFALDLYERKLFKLPFEVTAFAFEGPPNETEHVKGSRPAGGLMIVAHDEDDSLSAIMCTESRDRDGVSVGGIPIGTIMQAKLRNPREGTVDVVESTYPIVSDKLMAMMYGNAGRRGHDLMVQRLCSNLIGCMGMAVMLMSKGVTTECIEAPTKLNKARLNRRKPAICDRYVVKIAAGDLRTINTEGGEESIAGHVRGSPRLHWRRGHFRCLGRGTEAETVVPVVPTLVGANEGAQAIRKAYAVRG